MKTNKLKTIIIVVLILILILVGVFAYLYFGTDILKSNKQLFFKYLGQTFIAEEESLGSKLIEYENKKKTQKYEDSGNFYVDMNLNGLETEMLQVINDFNIEYSGKVDNGSRKSEQQISINYADGVSFPINYKYANETLGLQTDYVSSKYIGIENSNLKEFVEKFGVTDTENFPDSIDFNTNNQQAITLTEEETQQLINKYQSILEGIIGEKEFTKTEENATVNYSVQITNEEFKNLAIALLEAMKDDQIILPKIEEMLKGILEFANTYSDEEITVQNSIQSMIDSLNETEVEEGTSTLTVSQTNGKTTEIALISNEEEFRIKGTEEQGILNSEAEIIIKDMEAQQTIRYFFNVNYQGLDQSTSVNETYQFGIIATIDGEEQKLVYNLNNTTTFNENSNISDFSEDDIEILNEYDGEQIATLLSTIVNRIGEVNTMQMEEIGFTEYGNPMIYVFPITSLPILISSQIEEGIDETDLSQQEIEAFNASFEQYAGEQRGTIVRSLLQAVLANNISQDSVDNRIQISGDITMDVNDTDAPSSSVETGATYQVELIYDEEGKITEIQITEI